VRPERLSIAAPGSGGGERNALGGTVADLVFVGAGTKVYVSLPGGPQLMAYQAAGEGLAPGAPVSVTWPVEAGVLLGE
jgi:hypothetical protein